MQRRAALQVVLDRVGVGIITFEVLLHLLLVNRVHKGMEVRALHSLDGQSPAALRPAGTSQLHAVHPVLRLLQDLLEGPRHVSRVEHRVFEEVVPLVSSFSKGSHVPEHLHPDSGLKDVRGVVRLVAEMREYNDREGGVNELKSATEAALVHSTLHCWMSQDLDLRQPTRGVDSLGLRQRKAGGHGPDDAALHIFETCPDGLNVPRLPFYFRAKSDVEHGLIVGNGVLEELVEFRTNARLQDFGWSHKRTGQNDVGREHSRLI